MARPREFDRDEALAQAIEAFSERGYAGTSTEDLLKAMNLSRQSLYNAFGDKRGLYLEALRAYVADSVSEHLQILNRATSARKGIEQMLSEFVVRPARTCLGTQAICEFGRSDPDITTLSETAAHTLRAALERCVAQAKADGEVSQDIDARAAAHFLGATLSGIKIAARAGAPKDVLRDIAVMALRSLD
ncbi:TetR/AcrR family transcriptional regulator [Paraburkholderia rhizosphaerae]|uniref:TetR family transcriptional regulator n=1 Tax=Paraburkholderia rhizosphaerae TaxID=480658 RepID=A0A4R8LI25_9BURK|nr:TetR/AcrR family transcriptional regulator [Paraburkholderia rhizosphaerae]TDY42048.1 TetR family transcriptional regulator [Paraburkholderia rhizosphaerae]